MNEASSETPEKRSTLALLRTVREDRPLLAMLLLGTAAGLPYAVLTGTLNAWFTKAEVDLSTIGVLSWIGLAYAFKFLWSPTLHRSTPPVIGRIGARRGWIALFQIAIMVSIGTIALMDPRSNLAVITVAALLGVVASASQDIVIDAWRIEVARDDGHLDALSAIYQFGYRAAAFLGGFVALTLAARIGWNLTFGVMALLMALGPLGVRIAPEPVRDGDDGQDVVQLGARLAPRVRYLGITLVMVAWAVALGMLGWFMVQSVTSADPPSSRDFIVGRGPWIVALTVLMPAVVSAILLWLETRGAAAVDGAPDLPGLGFLDTLHRFILEPFMELVSRLGPAAPLVLLLVLSYRFTDMVWGAFAYPFYLGTEHGAMGFTLDEVALASKMIGAIVTIGGTALGAVALRRFGRMPCLIAGAILAAATNMLFWDLASGAPFVGGFLEITRLNALFALVHIDPRLGQLITAIAGENLAVGFASVTFVAYLSSIVNPAYAAIQYALLASLTMLIGTLGRGALGELIEQRGFAHVFVLTALMGLVAVAASTAEAIRLRRRDVSE